MKSFFAKKYDDEFDSVLVRFGLTSILIGYFLIWLPQQLTGLSFTGYELGEWVKFIPQVKAGELLPSRHFFYIPPITFSLILISWTLLWKNHRWQTWIVRVLAISVSFLALPSLEAVRFEPMNQWVIQLLLVLLPIIFAVLTLILGRMSLEKVTKMQQELYIVLGFAGLSLPTWAFLAIRPLASSIFQEPVPIGPGVWLNAGGHIAICAVGLISLAR